MPNPAAARRRLGRGAARAVAIAHKKRRDSHRGYPDLSMTHLIPIGGSVLVTDAFPTPAREITFKFRLDRQNPVANGVLITLGDQGSIGVNAGDLEIVTNGESFIGAFAGAPIDSAEIVVALKPVEGKVRAWVDSACCISGITTLFPYSWATSGLLTYGSIAGAQVLSDLEVFDLQLPRHVDECGDITNPVVPPSDFCGILYRAARAANLATTHFPFLGPCETLFPPPVDFDDLLYRAARAANLATEDFPFLGDS